MTMDLNARIAEWRQKSREGTLSEEDLQEAVIALRQGRVAAAERSKTGRKRVAKDINTDDLLNELENL